MDNYCKQSQYPLVPFVGAGTPLNERQVDLLKETLIDFKVNIYSNEITELPLVYISNIVVSGSFRTIKLLIRVKFAGSLQMSNAAIVNLPFNLSDSMFASEFVRVHFDLTDAENVDARLLGIDGHISFANFRAWETEFSQSLNLEQSKVMFEPSTINVIGNHVVESIRCQYALPLITQNSNQTPDERYTPLSDYVKGNVNFVGGNNCVINLQQFSNTVLVSALQNANGDDEERCGVWANKIPEAINKDVLCNEAVYSLGGAYPDDAGNVTITGNYPITVSSLSRAQLPDKFQNIANQFPHVEKFIYIGTPTRALEGACPPINTDTCSP